VLVFASSGGKKEIKMKLRKANAKSKKDRGRKRLFCRGSKTTQEETEGRPPSTRIITVLFALTLMVMMMMVSMNVYLDVFAGRIANKNDLNMGQAIVDNASTLVDKSTAKGEN